MCKLSGMLKIRFQYLHKYRPDSEDAAFEQVLTDHIGSAIDKHFYSKLAGVTHANADGGDRQQLIAKCAMGEFLELVREPNNAFDPNAIRVVNEDGDQLGYLARDAAEQIARDLDQRGRIWIAVVRKAEKAEEGKYAGAVLCLARLTEQCVKDHPAKVSG